MKLNRRGFFGVTAGAALAAPTVAKTSVVGSGASNAFNGNVGLGSGSMSAPPAADDDWRLKQIVSLVQQARGKRVPERESELQIYSTAEHKMNAQLQQIDALKSVAPHRKHMMAHHAVQRERDRQDRHFAVHRLLYEFNIPEMLWKDYE